MVINWKKCLKSSIHRRPKCQTVQLLLTVTLVSRAKQVSTVGPLGKIELCPNQSGASCRYLNCEVDYQERNITWWSGTCSGIDELYTSKSTGVYLHFSHPSGVHWRPWNDSLLFITRNHRKHALNFLVVPCNVVFIEIRF